MVRRIFVVIFIIGVVLVFAGSFSLLTSAPECPSPAVFKEGFGCVIVDPPRTNVFTLEATCPIGFTDVNQGRLVTTEELLSPELIACQNLAGETLFCGMNQIGVSDDFFFIECIVDGVPTILP